MPVENKYQDSEVADANRKTSMFCRYKKTYYLALILFCLLLVIVVVGVYLKFYRSPAKTKAPSFTPATSTPSDTPATLDTNNFLQDLLNKID